MTDEWRVDDLALCISRHARYPDEVQPGAIFTVSAVLNDMPDVIVDHKGTALRFRDAPELGPKAAYCARRFRKVTPGAPDSFDAEVIDLLVGSKHICR